MPVWGSQPGRSPVHVGWPRSTASYASTARPTISHVGTAMPSGTAKLVSAEITILSGPKDTWTEVIDGKKAPKKVTRPPTSGG